MYNDAEHDFTFIPTDPAIQKGIGLIFSCSAEHKKCCEKFKKGKRCKKCPGRKK